MWTLLGIIAILLAIGLYAWRKLFEAREQQNERIKEENIQREERNMRLAEELTPLPSPPGINPWLVFSAGILLFFLNGLFFWNPAGTATAIQYPWGGDKMVTTQGPKIKAWGNTIPLSYEISVKDVLVKRNAEGEFELPETTDGIYNREAHRWEFSDAIKADIATSVIVGVAIEDEEVFLNMADRNRSEAKLIYGRVIPNIDAALKNTCKLMDAQEYISGKASDFDRYFRDQLENGMYLVEEYYEEEEVPEIIGDTATVRTLNPNKSSTKQLKFRIKRRNGDILRDNKSNSLTQYGIKIYQAQVTGIDWEESFDERLQLQKEQVAQTQLEKQEAEKEYYRAKKEIAKGESEKAAERARLEKEQIKLTIAAETEAKVAEQNLIAEKKKYEVAQYEAKSKKVAADAQYYENQKLVQAGLTPQERMEMEIKIADLVSKNLATMKVPANMIVGGDSKGNTTEALLQIDLMNSILSKKSK